MRVSICQVIEICGAPLYPALVGSALEVGTHLVSFELDFFGESPAADWADVGLLVVLSVLVDPVELQPLLAFEVLAKD